MQFTITYKYEAIPALRLENELLVANSISKYNMAHWTAASAKAWGLNKVIIKFIMWVQSCSFKNISVLQFEFYQSND